MTDTLRAGMMTATDRYQNGGSTIRFLVAYYARWIIGATATAVAR